MWFGHNNNITTKMTSATDFLSAHPALASHAHLFLHLDADMLQSEGVKTLMMRGIFDLEWCRLFLRAVHPGAHAAFSAMFGEAVADKLLLLDASPDHISGKETYFFNGAECGGQYRDDAVSVRELLTAAGVGGDALAAVARAHVEWDNARIQISEEMGDVGDDVVERAATRYCLDRTGHGLHGVGPRAVLIWIDPVVDGDVLKRLRHERAVKKYCDQLKILGVFDTTHRDTCAAAMAAGRLRLPLGSYDDLEVLRKVTGDSFDAVLGDLREERFAVYVTRVHRCGYPIPPHLGKYVRCEQYDGGRRNRSNLLPAEFARVTGGMYETPDEYPLW